MIMWVVFPTLLSTIFPSVCVLSTWLKKERWRSRSPFLLSSVCFKSFLQFYLFVDQLGLILCQEEWAQLVSYKSIYLIISFILLRCNRSWSDTSLAITLLPYARFQREVFIKLVHHSPVSMEAQLFPLIKSTMTTATAAMAPTNPELLRAQTVNSTAWTRDTNRRSFRPHGCLTAFATAATVLTNTRERVTAR